MLKREKNLSEIRPFYHSELIKVLIGIRRAGKSVILDQIRAELMEEGISENHIIYLDFELLDYKHLRHATALHEYVKSLVCDVETHYLFFDEIQAVADFEEAINSIRAGMKVSIFMTGSNSNILSGELATHLAGRFVQFHVYPFIYEEVMAYKKLLGQQSGESDFLDYLKWGSMPQRFEFHDEKQIRVYYQDLYASVVLRDIVSRGKISDTNLLRRILEFMLDNSSRVFSANSISKFLKNEGQKVGVQTVYNYMEIILNSFIMSKAGRFDVQGKEYLAHFEKYYVADQGFRQLNKTSLSVDYDIILENTIYNELVARGFLVYIGKVKNREIDFIATRNEKKYYFQVAYLLASPETVEREFGVYSDVNDQYPKYVISLDSVDFSQNGIIHVNAKKFLENFNEFVHQ